MKTIFPEVIIYLLSKSRRKYAIYTVCDLIFLFFIAVLIHVAISHVAISLKVSKSTRSQLLKFSNILNGINLQN